MSTIIPSRLDAAAERLVSPAVDELQLGFEDAGAALSLALAQVTGMALDGMDELELDDLLAALKDAALAYTSSGESSWRTTAAETLGGEL